MTPSSLKKGYKPGSWNKLRRRKYNKIRAYVFEYKSKTPCKDCGKIFHPFVMDFDHIGDDKKIENRQPRKQGFEKCHDPR